MVFETLKIGKSETSKLRSFEVLFLKLSNLNMEILKLWNFKTFIFTQGNPQPLNMDEKPSIFKEFSKYYQYAT